MKKNQFLLILFIAYLFVCVSCKQNKEEIIIEPIEYQKKKRDKNNLYKKGIEHMADYQKQIRKGINETESTYKKGYLIKEYNKATQNNLRRSASSTITPVFMERGPNNVPGRTRGIAIDPNNADRWFLGTVGGGVWRTENAGATWTTLTDFKISNLATSTIVISQTDSNILYIGTGEPFGSVDAIGGSGVFKTTDGGVTWQHLTATASFGGVGRIIINPENDDNVLIATSLGVYRTMDGGSSWTRTYFHITSTGGTIRILHRVQDLDADPSDFNVQYASVNRLGLIKSIDGGVKWSLVLNGIGINENHIRFETSVSKVNPSVVIVCAYSSSKGTVSPNTDLYISRNAGANFTNLTATSGAIVDRLDLVGGQGWYDNIVLTHPFNENIFYVGGVELFKVTVNGDNTFTALEIAATQQNENLNQINTNVHVDQHGLVVIKGINNQFQLILANDGGVFYSNLATDPGVNQGNWSSSGMGKNTTQLYGATKQNGFDNYLVGAQDNGCWASLLNNANASKNYMKALNGDGFEVIWHYDNIGDFIVTTARNTIGKYVDLKGVSLTSLSGSPIFYTKISNADNNPDVVFSISGDGVWRSTDFATTWNLTLITSGFILLGNESLLNSLNVKVSPADPDVVWAGAMMREDGTFTLHVSQDNGLSFVKAGTYNNPSGAHNFLISGLATSYIERNRAYALFSAQGVPKILKTENLGDTWSDITGFETSINTGFPDVAVHSVLEMPFDKNIIWAGTDIGVFETENGGTSWNLVTGIPSVAVYDMKVVNSQVVIATHGRGVWSATISELDTYILPVYPYLAEVSTKQKEFTIYPTVSKGNFTLYVKDDTVRFVKMTIFNTKGQQVYNKEIDFTSSRKQKILVNLNSGVYIANIISQNNKKSSIKILIE